jgi:hypothetical protein
MKVPGLSSCNYLGFQLYRNEANSNAVPDILVYDGSSVRNQQQATVAGLESGKSYWIAYRVLNHAGWSALSPYYQLRTGKLPAAPLTAPRQKSVSESHIEFEWSPSEDVGGAEKLEFYQIYISVGQSTEKIQVSAATLSYSHAASANQNYRVTVSAESLIGEGPQSNPATFWSVNVPDAL